MILSISTQDILLKGVHMQHEDVKCELRNCLYQCVVTCSSCMNAKTRLFSFTEDECCAVFVNCLSLDAPFTKQYSTLTLNDRINYTFYINLRISETWQVIMTWIKSVLSDIFNLNYIKSEDFGQKLFSYPRKHCRMANMHKKVQVCSKLFIYYPC